MSKTKKSGDHLVIRHAYEGTLTACARLASFATGQPTDSDDGLIDSRQVLLATDDLIAFSTNARRLIHNSGSLKNFIDTNINVEMDGTNTTIPVTRVINIIIHHKFLRIARSNFELKLFEEGVAAVIEYYPILRNSFPPIVMVESDQGSRIKFRLLELIKTFEPDVLVPIVQICADAHLFLDDDI